MNMPTHEQLTRAGDRWEAAGQYLVAVVVGLFVIAAATLIGAGIFAVIIQTFFRSTL